MALTSGQQERLRRLLEDELRKAGRTALAGGASPDELADLLAERRRTLAEAERSSTPTDSGPRPAAADVEHGHAPADAEPRRAPSDTGLGHPDDRPQPPDDAESRPGQA